MHSPNQRRSVKNWLKRHFALAVLCAALSGCGEEVPPTPRVISIGDPITSEEWAQFERLVKSLGDEGLKEWPCVYPPLPDWQPTRTLPVADLAAAEQRVLDEHWNPQQVAAQITHRSQLMKQLRQVGMSAEQFAGLMLAVGAATARWQLSTQEPSEEALRRGRKIVHDLQHDPRIFSSLEVDERVRILDQALWLHRLDRVERLRQVPAENVELVRQHADWLAEVLPPCFLGHPLAEIADLLGEQGLPFIELPQSGSDLQLEWDPATAIVGQP